MLPSVGVTDDWIMSIDHGSEPSDRASEGESSDGADWLAALKKRLSRDVQAFNPEEQQVELHKQAAAHNDIPEFEEDSDEVFPQRDHVEPVRSSPEWIQLAHTAEEAKRVSPEWSERDARLLKRLSGPWRESVSNKPFEPAERVDIAARLQELMMQLKETQETQELAVKHLEALEKTLKETREASERMGRKDWAVLAIGAFTTLVISVALPPAMVVIIAKLFIHKVAHLFSEELAS